ncbi:porin [Microvirga sp. VF16]|uniref:porin n=1 Tax=Microvirga sp. VF16 TaxID=2807101 RepID=UPI00193E2F4C|nr:porin [Microvirga sp. VF16]QRM27798.1 porin [Microvirga sp. VF16]
MKHCAFAFVLSSLALISQAQAVTACPPGFAMLQASDTCVRISGRVRAETLVGSTRNRSSDAYGTHAGGRVKLDVRKQTEYGPLRAVISAGNLGR